MHPRGPLNLFYYSINWATAPSDTSPHFLRHRAAREATFSTIRLDALARKVAKRWKTLRIMCRQMTIIYENRPNDGSSSPSPF